MVPQKALKSIGWVLFSTIFVYPAAFAQSADDLYLQLRKNPHASKEMSDRAQAETIDKKRLEQFRQDQEALKREALANQQEVAREPKPTAEEVADEEKRIADGKDEGPAKPAPAPRNAPAPSSVSPSSDSPKVAFDPLPDEIQFDGEEPAPAAAAAKPAVKRGPKPPPRKLKNH